jgi:hypothetical protein
MNVWHILIPLIVEVSLNVVELPVNEGAAEFSILAIVIF